MSEIVQKALKNEADQLAQEYGIDAHQYLLLSSLRFDKSKNKFNHSTGKTRIPHR